MQYKLLFVLLLTMLLFFGCITTDYNTTNTNQQNIPNSSITSKKTGNTIAYILERGERLSTLIVTQNDLNGYAKYENEPTDNFYKEKFSEYEKLTKEVIDKQIKEITEDDIKKFQKEFRNISFNEFMDIFKKIGFLYKVEYNKNTKIWHIELIGRSTTLKLGFANTRNEGMSYYNKVDSYVNSWMRLNNIKDLDAVFRIYINDIDDDIIPELFGLQLDGKNDVNK